jgi:hypothetical protein
MCGNTILHGSWLRPERSLSDVRSLSGYVYEVVGVQSGDDFLQTLDHCVTALREGKITVDDLRRLARALTAVDRPDALADAVIAQGDIPKHADKRKRAVPYGTQYQRRQIAELLREFVRTHPESPDARTFALAALLLSAQDSNLFGAGYLASLVHDPAITLAAAITQRQKSRLERHLADHCEVSRRAIVLETHADALLSKARKGTVPTQFCSTLEALAELAPSRRDVQYQLAALYWRAQQVIGSEEPAFVALDTTLRNAVKDPVFDELLGERYGMQLGRTRKSMTEAELRSRIKEIRPSTPPSGSASESERTSAL